MDLFLPHRHLTGLARRYLMFKVFKLNNKMQSVYFLTVKSYLFGRYSMIRLVEALSTIAKTSVDVL